MLNPGSRRGLAFLGELHIPAEKLREFRPQNEYCTPFVLSRTGLKNSGGGTKYRPAQKNATRPNTGRHNGLRQRSFDWKYFDRNPKQNYHPETVTFIDILRRLK